MIISEIYLMDKITLLLDEYNKKVEKDYFLTQRNIRIGRLNTNPEKTRANPFTYHLQSPKKTMHQNQRRQVFLGDTSLNSYSNNLNLYKRSTTLSSRKMNRIMQNPDSSNNSKKNIIDNNDLKRLYNDIRNRINNYKTKKYNNFSKTIDNNLLLNIQSSLNTVPAVTEITYSSGYKYPLYTAYVTLLRRLMLSKSKVPPYVMPFITDV